MDMFAKHNQLDCCIFHIRESTLAEVPVIVANLNPDRVMQHPDAN